MYVKFSRFMGLQGMRKARVITNTKTEDIIVSGIRSIEVPKCWKWAGSLEAVILNGAALERQTEELIETVKELKAKNASALVLETGPYIKQIDERVIKYAEQIDFTIIELPFDGGAGDVPAQLYRELFNLETERKSVENFMNELVYGEYNEKIKERAVLYGYQMNRPYIAVILEINGFDEATKNKDENTKANIRSAVFSIARNIFESKRRDRIFCMDDKKIFIFMLTADDDKERLSEQIGLVQKAVKEFYKDFSVSAGIGSRFYRIENLKKSVFEARGAIQIARNSVEGSNIGNYDEIGIYRLFFELQDVEIFEETMRAILGKLMEYDDENGNNLLDTLEVYLKNDRSISKSAEELFLHRNTLKYRLNRIEEVLGCDLTDVDTVFNFMLAFKIKGFLINSRPVL